ncbi:MAG: sigma-70 family RNA polymerase sigma factor [Ilumatobacteraceae bacterium]
MPDAVAIAVDFEHFYADTCRDALALARALTGSWTDAEDLVQDAYAAAHRNWPKLQAYDEPAAWIRRVLLNRSASRWRRLGREVAALTRLGGRRETDPDATPDPADGSLWRVVATLPRQQVRVVALYYVADLGVAEIAAELGCSTGTVKTHLSRARAALRPLLGDAPEDDHDD